MTYPRSAINDMQNIQPWRNEDEEFIQLRSSNNENIDSEVEDFFQGPQK